MNRQTCKKCGKLFIDAGGRPDSKILLVGEFPGRDETIKGVPFVGKTGDILKAEMALAGLPYANVRVTNLWQHAKDEKGCDVDMHKNMMAKEFRGKTHILLMGSDLTKLLFDTGVMELSGLEMKHDMFPGVRLFVSPNPALAMHGPIGEFRLAMTRFVEAINGSA